jgi:N-acylglucosamine-6-phosphate 2-epimerase
MTTLVGDGPAVLSRLAGGLIVSCQAAPGNPLRGSQHMLAMARAAVAAGAVGIRAEGLEDVGALVAELNVPVIGLWKDGPPDGVFITRTLRHAESVARCGPAVVALDATGRPRPDGSTFAQAVRLVHDAGCLVMADVATLEQGVRADAEGADLVGTTLAGYTPDTARGDGPALPLIAGLSARCTRAKVVAEGRIWTPEEARAALDAGAFTVVVGSAITRPGDITARFVAAMTARPAARLRWPTGSGSGGAGSC